MESNRDWTLLLIAVLAIGFCWYLIFQDSSVEHEAQLYCQMVHDKDWPDFHHVYAQQCNKDGTVNWKYINQ